MPLIGRYTIDGLPTRQNKRHRAFGGNPFPIVAARDVQVTRITLTPITGWMSHPITPSQQGSLRRLVFRGNVQIEEHPTGLFVSIVVQVKKYLAITARNTRPEAAAVANSFETAQ